MSERVVCVSVAMTNDASDIGQTLTPTYLHPTSDQLELLRSLSVFSSSSYIHGFLWRPRTSEWSSAYSGAKEGFKTLTDLNDYITPSQACIKPVEQVGGSSSNVKDPGAASVRYVPLSSSCDLNSPDVDTDSYRPVGFLL